MNIDIDSLENIYELNVKKFGKTAVLTKAKEIADIVAMDHNRADNVLLWSEITEKLFNMGLFPETYYPGCNNSGCRFFRNGSVNSFAVK